MLNQEKSLFSLRHVKWIAIKLLVLSSVNGAPPRKDVPYLQDKLSYKTAAGFLANGNDSLDPCDDFYEYTCSQWTVNKKIPNNTDNWGTLHVITERTNMQLRDLLAERARPLDHPLITAAKVLYRACMNTAEIERMGLKPLMREIAHRGIWPMITHENAPVEQKSWLHTHCEYVRVTGEGALFNINVLCGSRSTSDCELSILPPTTVFGRYTHIGSAHSSTYGQYLADIILYIRQYKLSGNKLGKLNIKEEKRSKKLLEDVGRAVSHLMKFRYELLKIRSSSFPVESNGKEDRMSISELQAWNNKLTKTIGAIQINWAPLIKNTFKYARKVIIKDVQRVHIGSKTYLEKLLVLLNRTDSRVIANHIHMHFVELHMKYFNSKMRKLAEQVFIKLTDAKLETQTLRSYQCVQGNAMQHVLSRMYVDRFYPNSMEKQVKQVFNELVHVAAKRINASWLDTATKPYALQKLYKIKFINGYHSWNKDFNLLRNYYRGLNIETDYLANVLSSKRHRYAKELEKLVHTETVTDNFAFIPNLHYERDTNTIDAPAALWQSSHALNSSLPVIYATIAFALAHEIAHAFDPENRQYDGSGDYTEWWSRHSSNLYMRRLKCIRNKYNQYVIKELVRSVDEPVYNNGELTLTENFADIIGLQFAFDAYMEKLQKIGENIQTTLAIQQQQIFFLAYANAFCAYLNPIYLPIIIKDSHSVPRLRVNGPLSNLSQFSIGYNCSNNSNMNSSPKCKFW